MEVDRSFEGRSVIPPPTPTTVVDHIILHRGNRTLFWDQKTGNSFVRTAIAKDVNWVVILNL